MLVNNQFLSKYLLLVTNSSVFLFFSLSLVAKKGYTYGALLLLLAALLTLPVWFKKVEISKGCVGIGLAFATMAMVDIAKGLSFQPEFSDFEHALKYLVAIFLLLYLTVYPPKPNFIWWGIGLGAIGTGVVAIFYTWVSPESTTYQGRVSPYLNPIQYGNLSILLAILALCGLNTPQKMLKFILLVAILFGLFASVLSLSRGGWVAFIITLGVLSLINFRKEMIFSRRALLVSGFLMAVVLVSYSSKVGYTIKVRVSQAITELTQAYEQGRAGDGSVGLRLQMWQFALHEGSNYPILGANKAQLKHDKQQWVEEGRASQSILQFGHFHNEFINTFAKKGLLGLLALLVLFFVPLYFFLIPDRQIAKQHPVLSNLRLAGVAQIVMFMGFGLTEVSLDVYNVALLMFLLPLSFLYASYTAQMKKIIQ